jgi:O-antigen/teichoic acid export membrane protein
MLFLAFRLTDAVNFLIGVWVVPSYIGVSELGAVMPLATFASLLAVPAGVFATTFLKEVNVLATRSEYGKIKTLIRGVFAGAAVVMVLALVLCQFVMPLFLERLRISGGSLGLLILAASFARSISPVYTNALQALKKFRAISFISLVGAPIRLVVMLAAMPFRALSGYFVAQASTPAFQIFASVFFLRKEMSVKSEPYWNREVFRRFATVFVLIMFVQLFSLLGTTVEQMIIRQRLAEIDSAAYYMITRFAEISGFLSGALSVTLFPYAGEMAGRGESTRPLLLKCSLSMTVFGAVLAIFFFFWGEPILRVLPQGGEYASYARYIPWLIGINTVSAIVWFHVTTELSAGRFAFLKWWIPSHGVYALLMLATAGRGYFEGIAGGCITEFLGRYNITSLKAVMAWMSVFAAARLAFSARDIAVQRSKNV